MTPLHKHGGGVGILADQLCVFLQLQ